MLSIALVTLIINHVYGYGWQWADYPPKTPGAFYGTAPTCNGHCQSPNTYLWFSGLSEGDGSLCTSGSKVYCNTVPDPWASTAWKGTAPSCGANCGDCYPGYCIATDQAGDGNVCATGRKVLCGATGPPVSTSEVTNDIKLVNTTEIEMGFIFKVHDDDQVSLISHDNHNNLITGILQFLSYIEASAGTNINQASVTGLLLNPNDYLVNVKFNYDTVTNAEGFVWGLYWLYKDNEDVSSLIKYILSSIDTGFNDIHMQFVEGNLGNQFISNN